MLLNLFGFLFASKVANGGQDLSQAFGQSVHQTLIVLLGVGIGIIGIALIMQGTKAAQLTELVASALPKV